MENKLKSIIEKYGKNRSRLMDILIDVQDELGHVSDEAKKIIAEQIGISKVDVEETSSFYHFFSDKPVGKYAIHLNNSAVADMMGREKVAKAFEEAAGVKFGEVTNDGSIGLHYTADIGMNDQEPAAIINGKIFTNLTPEKAKAIIGDIKSGKAVQDMITETGDGNNGSELVKAMVNNNIKKKGEVIFSDYESGTALKKVIEMQEEQVIEEVKKSNIRGRGGAGFPTGMKWQFTRQAEGDKKYIICNADEGEPGTFKDRVLLIEMPEKLFEGMAIAGYAIGSDEGVIYLRAEYRYLKAHLENTLKELKNKNLLGTNIAGKEGFNFDIRIQLGAGAYVCGEESALIESVEGKRGEPRFKPPFPAQKGLFDKPTAVNNVETFCAINKIIEKGGEWYTGLGTKDSSGTKVLSISGDCKEAGVYEIEWGMTIQEMLDMVGAIDTQAVQVAGPSGVCLPPSQFNRKIAFEDLPTGGSMIVVGKDRNLLKELTLNFMEFMLDESCGSCAPCRALNVLLKNKLEKILNGKGTKHDLADIEKWSNYLTKTTRCGLGQTSSNPMSTALENFKDKFEALVSESDFVSEFDMDAAVADSSEYVGRTPNV